MKQKTFFFISGIVFLIVAIIHLKRSIFGWTFVVNGWEVPMLVSWLAVFLTGTLAYHGFKFFRDKKKKK